MFIYNVYLSTDYHNHRSGRLFALASEKLYTSISIIISIISACLIVGDFNCNLTVPSACSSLIDLIFHNHFYVVHKTKISQTFTIPRPYPT